MTNNRSVTSSYCISHLRPNAELATDLQKNRVARYNFITPNVCDDMHDACRPLNDPIKQGDTWLRHNIPTIMSSQAYKHGGAIFVVWDEANSGDGPIGLIALSSLARGGGYHNSIHYTHSSLLRTTEEIFGVRPLLGDAAQTTDLGDLFVSGAVKPPAGIQPPHGPGGSWRLAFDDEFNGKRFDTGKWQTLLPWGACSIPTNQELQCYMANALSQTNGILSIRAGKQKGKGYSYSSGMISSYKSYSTTYGYFEMRVQVPKGQGFWSTFWLVPHDESWPPEIDAMEIRGNAPTTIHMTNHFGTSDRPRQTHVTWNGPNISAGFHTFGLDWESASLTWYIDGVQRLRIIANIPHKPMYMIANLAVGGDWPGPPAATTPFPSYLKIDYVRAFKRA